MRNSERVRSGCVFRAVVPIDGRTERQEIEDKKDQREAETDEAGAVTVT